RPPPFAVAAGRPGAAVLGTGSEPRKHGLCHRRMRTNVVQDLGALRECNSVVGERHPGSAAASLTVANVNGLAESRGRCDLINVRLAPATLPRLLSAASGRGTRVGRSESLRWSAGL